MTTGGALLSALLVTKLAPEATGHGTDEAIEAVHTDPRAIRFRAVLVKMVASALTIGSGGSGGREGPTAQISAGFCSLLTRRLNLSDEDGRAAVALGIGAGIGAIFAAPLGGAVLAASITYRDDFDYRCLLPGFITSGMAYAVLGSFLGFDPLFGYIDAEYRFERAWPLVWFVVIGLAGAAVGYLYARVFHAAVRLTRRLPGGPVLKPAVGGLLVGLLGLLIPADPEQRLRLGAAGRAAGLLAADSAVDHPRPAARQDRRHVAVDRQRRIRGLFGPGIVIGAFLGAACGGGRVGRLPGMPARSGNLRRGRDDDVFRQRRAGATGDHDHGGRDDRLVLGGAGGDHRGGHRALLLSRTNVTIYEAQRLDRETAEAEREHQGGARNTLALCGPKGLTTRAVLGHALAGALPLVGTSGACRPRFRGGRTHEPLELLQRPRLPDQQGPVRHRVEVRLSRRWRGSEGLRRRRRCRPGPARPGAPARCRGPPSSHHHDRSLMMARECPSGGKNQAQQYVRRCRSGKPADGVHLRIDHLVYANEAGAPPHPHSKPVNVLEASKECRSL